MIVENKNGYKLLEYIPINEEDIGYVDEIDNEIIKILQK